MAPSTQEAAPDQETASHSKTREMQTVPAAPAFVPERLDDHPGKVFYGAALAAQSRAHRRLRDARADNDQHEPKDRIRSSDSAVLEAVFACTTHLSAVVDDNAFVRKIETLSGLGRTAVKGSLRRLAYHGVITWRPHEGRAWSRTRAHGLPVGGRNALLSVLTPAELDAYLRNGSTRGKGRVRDPIVRTKPRKGKNVDVLRAREGKIAGRALTGGPPEDRSPSRQLHEPNTVQVFSTNAALAAGIPARPSCRCADDLHSACPTCHEYTSQRRRAAGL